MATSNFYYVSVGNNGGVITDSYDRALLCKKYLRGHVWVKKQPNFEEAEAYLMDHIAEKAPFGCPLPLKCGLNQVITFRKLMSE